MISQQDSNAIIDIAKNYNVNRILLFGSSADPSVTDPHDIDLGVEGIPPEQYFRFYGDLMMRLSKPVDLVDLAQEGRFVSLVLRDGVQLYANS